MKVKLSGGPCDGVLVLAPPRRERDWDHAVARCVPGTTDHICIYRWHKKAKTYQYFKTIEGKTAQDVLDAMDRETGVEHKQP